MKKIKIIIAVLFLTFSCQIMAQSGQTIYYMPAIPQASYSNPAFQPEARWFFGSPGLSYIGFDIGHTGFRFSDIVIDTDSGQTVDLDLILNDLGNTNFVFFENTYEPISFGFRIAKKGYFTFHVAQKSSLQFVYPRELFEFPILGNGDPKYLGKSADFSDLGVNMSVYTEIALGYQHNILDNLSVGGRVKILGGLFNASTDNKALSIHTDETDFSLTADADLTFNTNLPHGTFDSLPDGQEFSGSDIPDYIKKNFGIAFDLGATYEFQGTFLFSASVVDLGFINWKSNPKNHTSKGTFTFSGIDINDVISNDSIEIGDKFDQLGDSITDIFDFQETNSAYKQMLSPKIYLGASIYITENSVAGILLRNNFYRGKYYPTGTLSFNHRFGKILSLSASYTAYRGSYFNVGGGFSLKLGPYQLYAISDNIYGAFKPDFAKNINIQFGMNWLIGAGRDKNEASLDNE